MAHVAFKLPSRAALHEYGTKRPQENSMYTIVNYGGRDVRLTEEEKALLLHLRAATTYTVPPPANSRVVSFLADLGFIDEYSEDADGGDPAVRLNGEGENFCRAMDDQVERLRRKVCESYIGPAPFAPILPEGFDPKSIKFVHWPATAKFHEMLKDFKAGRAACIGTWDPIERPKEGFSLPENFFDCGSIADPKNPLPADSPTIVNGGSGTMTYSAPSKSQVNADDFGEAIDPEYRARIKRKWAGLDAMVLDSDPKGDLPVPENFTNSITFHPIVVDEAKSGEAFGEQVRQEILKGFGVTDAMLAQTESPVDEPVHCKSCGWEGARSGATPKITNGAEFLRCPTCDSVVWIGSKPEETPKPIKWREFL